MNKYIVLLKGINVGGHKKVPMAELRELLSNEGFKNVQSYIQSGNIIIDSSLSLKKTEDAIQTVILNHFGHEVSILAKTRKEFKRIFDDSPFKDAKKKASYFMMLHNVPSDELIAVASEKKYQDEEYYIIKDCIYIYCENGFGRAKFNANFFERKLETFATARNYNTMLKLLSLSE